MSMLEIVGEESLLWRELNDLDDDREARKITTPWKQFTPKRAEIINVTGDAETPTLSNSDAVSELARQGHMHGLGRSTAP